MEELFEAIIGQMMNEIPVQQDGWPSDEDFILHEQAGYSAVEMYLLGSRTLSVCSRDGTVLRINKKILAGLLGSGANTSSQRLPFLNEDWIVSISKDSLTKEHVDTQRFAGVAANFEGWALTLHESDIPSREGASALLAFYSGEDQFADARGAGRPRKIPAVLEALRLLAPDGKMPNGMSWSDLHRQAVALSGLEFSQDTLRRAMRVLMDSDGSQSNDEQG